MDLIKKLHINPDKPLWAINMPESVRELLQGIEFADKVPVNQPAAQLLFFAVDSGMLNRILPLVAKAVAPETLFWICYPKKTGSIASDLILMEPWDVVTDAGFRGQTSISINEDWTGMRFTNAPRKKPSLAEVPMKERLSEGIDFVNRTATLPADAAAHLSQYQGLTELFNAMSFTHKREHIMAITEAKKPETRERRIGKMVEMLLIKLQEKELKAKR